MTIKFYAQENWRGVKNILTSISLSGDIPEEIDELIIPHITKSGHCIDKISPFVLKRLSDSLAKKGCFTKINRLIISDNISQIAESAFCENDLIKTVVWPKSCKTIPAFCFKKSSIESIENIENVKSIGKEAFANSKIKTILWPEPTKEISSAVFMDSSLERIRGIENITAIRRRAFSGSKISTIKWPKQCKCVSPVVFASCQELKEVVLNQNVEEIHLSAFINCSCLEAVDLSSCIFLKTVYPFSRGGIPPLIGTYYNSQLLTT